MTSWDQSMPFAFRDKNSKIQVYLYLETPNSIGPMATGLKAGETEMSMTKIRVIEMGLRP